MRRALLILIMALSAGALTACETPTPYQPVASGNAQLGGYTETRLEPNRWRVTFQGNTLTSRQTVENYLLNRAAELTVAQGFDWFETTDRNTDKQTETYVTPDPWGYGYGWRPYWRYYGRSGWGGYGYDPYWGGRFGRGPWQDPFWGPDVQTTQRFETSAEVIMGHGPKPEGDRRAFDARDVIKNLGPTIVRPK